VDVPPPNSFMGSSHEGLVDCIRMSDTKKDDLPVSMRIYTRWSGWDVGHGMEGLHGAWG